MHKNTQEEERQGMNLPSFLKRTEITQLEQAKTVKKAHGKQKFCLFPHKMLLIEEVTETQRLTRHCDQTHLHTLGLVSRCQCTSGTLPDSWIHLLTRNLLYQAHIKKLNEYGNMGKENSLEQRKHSSQYHGKSGAGRGLPL